MIDFLLLVTGFALGMAFDRILRDWRGEDES